MTLDNKPVHHGGCQCGAVRFTVEGKTGRSSICHCRMCQKAFGSVFAPLVNLGDAKLHWTKQPPAHFRSSTHVLRGFCAQCGTPLTYEAPGEVALALGAFDDPSAFPPTKQYGIEARLPYADSLHTLPSRATDALEDHAPWLAENQSFQHPDHE